MRSTDDNANVDNDDAEVGDGIDDDDEDGDGHDNPLTFYKLYHILPQCYIHLRLENLAFMDTFLYL